MRRAGSPLPSEAETRRLRALAARTNLVNWGEASTDEHDCLKRCAKPLEYRERSVNQIEIPGHQVAKAEMSLDPHPSFRADHDLSQSDGLHQNQPAIGPVCRWLLPVAAVPRILPPARKERGDR